MGLKAALFAVYRGEDGYFGTSPVADPDRSAELAARLPLRATGTGTAGPLELWPPSSSVGVGAYERGALVVHRSLLDDCMRADGHPVADELRSAHPDGTFVSLGLHSVVNAFGYTVIEGEDVRRFGGAEDRIEEDAGDLLPEEAPHFERSTVRDGRRYFTSPDLPGEELDAPAYGEELVASVAARLFGRRLDPLEPPAVGVPYFARRPWWKFWR